MPMTRKQLIEKIGIRGITSFRKEYLIVLNKVRELKWNDLRRLAKRMKVKGRKKIDLQNNILAVKKEQIKRIIKTDKLLKRIEAEQKKAEKKEKRMTKKFEKILMEHEEMRLIPIIRRKLRENRVVKPFQKIILQNSFIEDLKDTTMDDLLENNEAVVLQNNFREFVEEAQKALYKDKNILTAGIQALYASGIGDFVSVDVRYTKKIEVLGEKTNTNKLKFLVTLDETEINTLFIGYRIIWTMKKRQPTTLKLINRLLAYHPSSDFKFHKLTTSSTTTNKMCIYETYLNIMNKLKLKDLFRNRKKITKTKHKCEDCNKYFSRKCRLKDHKKNNKCIYGMLNNEDEEIRKAIKEGLLIKSLELLTKKDNTQVLIKFFNMKIIKNKVIGDFPILVNKGITTQITDIKEMMKYNGSKCMLYEKNIHVAPSIFNIKNKNKEKKEPKFVLRKNIIKGRTINIKDVYGYNVKTYIDNEGNFKPLYVILYGKKIYKHFNGDNCIKEFINYINSICTKIYNKKTLPNKKMDYIYIYGFNNSKLGNLMIYKEFHKLDPNTKYLFTNNQILYIKYNNVRIYDIAQYYNIENDIYKTAKEFNLNRMIKSKLIYKMAKEFIKDSIGMIGNRKYNYLNCPTTSSIAIKLYCQAFQTYNLKESPKEINKIENSSYFGGKCAVYKKKYMQDKDNLYYADINSSHASKMLGEMPYEFDNIIPYDNMVMEKEDIIPYNIYICDVEYKGNNKNFIPNILTRTKNKILELKNTYNVERYGCELIEAINNNCKVTVRKEIMYKPKILFKKFCKYIYNLRLQNKYKNKAKYIFYKKILTGLYGKLGQKKYNKSCLCRDDNEMMSKIKDFDNLINYEIIDDMLLIEYKNTSKYKYDIGKLVRFPSYITAQVRCEVSRVMRDVGHENIYYSATDSIFSIKKISSQYLDNKELGKWKTEKENIKKALFLAPNTYYIKYNKEENIKAGGLSKNKLNEKDYDDVMNNKEVKINEDLIFRTFRNIKQKKQERSLNTKYNKRKWDGNNSEAYNNINEFISL